MSNQPQQTPADPETVKRNHVMTSRIIHGSLLFGLLVFAVIAAAVGPGVAAGSGDGSEAAADQQGLSLEVLWIHAAVLTAVGLACAAIAPGIYIKQARAAASNAESQSEAFNAVSASWATLQLARACLLEGAGLFAAVCVLVTGDMLFLIPVAITIAALIVIAPTRAKLDAFESLVKNGPPHPTAV